MENRTLISINKLAQELDFNKSKLHYYTSLGLLKPVQILGKTMIFERAPVIKRIKQIERLQNKGISLKEIKNQLKKNT
jgi:DNA-binding transcriptional MerR regulator